MLSPPFSYPERVAYQQAGTWLHALRTSASPLVQTCLWSDRQLPYGRLHTILALSQSVGWTVESQLCQLQFSYRPHVPLLVREMACAIIDSHLSQVASGATGLTQRPPERKYRPELHSAE